MTRYQINDHIDRITIIEDTGKRKTDGTKIWLCVCNCGNVCELSANAMRLQLKRTGHCSCGCYQKELQQKRMTQVIPIGTKYPHFTIISDPIYLKRHVTAYKVQFEDGTVCQLTRKSIINNPNQYKSNHRTIEGELNIFKNQKDMPKVNSKYGKLTIIDDGFIKDNRLYYTCQCECGNVCTVTSRYLHSSKTPSCGCILSKGEFYITNFLKQNDYDFKTEYSFTDLNDIKPLRFDFAIFVGNELYGLIEYNGKQHYICDASSGWSDQDNFKIMKKHDQMKKEYCEKHNIPLLVIPYTLSNQEIEQNISNFLL